MAHYYYYVILLKTHMITLHYELSLKRILDYQLQANILETRMAIMIMADQHQCTGTGTCNDNPASIFAYSNSMRLQGSMKMIH